MKGFAGFPAGAMKFTPLPNLFFTALLPQINNLSELKVTLHIFWALYQKKGFPRCVTLSELVRDNTLLSGLRLDGRPPEEVLRDGLELAVLRGTLLHLASEIGGVAEDLYFLNTAHGREVIKKLRSGEIDLGQIVLEEGIGSPSIREERPNIFVLYEQNIGLLTPLIAEELMEAEKQYAQSWIEDAFKQAVEYNKRNWRYVRRILERWAQEGRDDETGGRRSKRNITTEGYGRHKYRQKG
ncbi:MAG: DnaD domain protein [Chloroflexi bacterium]|nr:DnaD domain protein [Chloroflexota bacterium]MCL5075664.1 DnaD domain protein [Chloroflexota bacterium]